jgi:hypothetical protein
MPQLDALELTPRRPRWISLPPPPGRGWGGLPPHPDGVPSLSHRWLWAARVTSRLGHYRSYGPPWPGRRVPDSPIPFASLARSASSGRCWTRSSQGLGSRQGPSHRAGWAGTPGGQPEGRHRHSLFFSIAPRQTPPPPGVGEACRLTPPGGLNHLARQVAPHHEVYPSHRPPGPGQACPVMTPLGLATRAGPAFPSPSPHGTRAASSGRCKSRGPRDSDCSRPRSGSDRQASSGAHSATRPSRPRPCGPW